MAKFHIVKIKCLYSVSEYLGSGNEYKIWHEITVKHLIKVGNKIVDHSDVVGASPVGAAQTTSSFPT